MKEYIETIKNIKEGKPSEKFWTLVIILVLFFIIPMSMTLINFLIVYGILYGVFVVYHAVIASMYDTTIYNYKSNGYIDSLLLLFNIPFCFLHIALISIIDFNEWLDKRG